MKRPVEREARASVERGYSGQLTDQSSESVNWSYGRTDGRTENLSSVVDHLQLPNATPEKRRLTREVEAR